MNFHVLTLFPDLIEQAFSWSITGRAQKRGLLNLSCVNIRDFAEEKRKGRVDDYSYGGGAGMIMQAEPVYRAVRSVLDRTGPQTRVLYLSPAGRTFDQKMAEDLAEEKDLVFLCGHYEGIDQRVISEVVTDQVSIGDFVLTGGELAALVMMDAVSRMVPGVLTNEDSPQTESFMGDGLLEYPQYSRPEVWHDQPVPPVLLSGNHGAVDRWRRDQSLRLTAERRPDLCKGAFLDKKDLAFLEEAGLTDAYREADRVIVKRRRVQKNRPGQSAAEPEGIFGRKAGEVPGKDRAARDESEAGKRQDRTRERQMIRNIVYDVGYVLVTYTWREKFQKFGYGQEGVRRLADHLFGSRDLNKDMTYWDQYDRDMVSDQDLQDYFFTHFPEDRVALDWFFTDPSKWCECLTDLTETMGKMKEKGYGVYLLSNYPRLLWEVQIEKAPFWNLVDGAVVSYQEKMGKPDEAFYRILFDRYGLAPQECLFLDDREENTRAGQAAGMQTLTLSSPQKRQEAVLFLESLPDLTREER